MQDQNNLEDILLEEKIRREVKEEMAVKSRSEELMDHVWELFQYLEDDRDEELVKSVAYFVKQHDFDETVLPVELRERVRQLRFLEAKEDSYGPTPDAVRVLDAGIEMLGY